MRWIHAHSFVALILGAIVFPCALGFVLGVWDAWRRGDRPESEISWVDTKRKFLEERER